jgi:hypothetical protein
MERLLRDAGLRAALSSRGLERARLFDRTHTTVRLADLLEGVGRSSA